MAEVVVIGAGVGGLCAAIDLARLGHDVTVYEAAAEAGGKLGRVVLDGVEADTGPTVLTMPDTLDALFLDAGTTLADELTLRLGDEQFDLHWPDGTRLTLHHDVDATLEAVSAQLGADAAGQFAAFLAYAETIWNEAAPAFVYGDAPTFGTAFGLGMRRPRALARIDPMRTMASAIDGFVKEPHLRDILRRYATYNGSDPRRAPATLNCIAHVELTMGCHGVEGGMYELARALERVATRHAVRFIYDNPVRGLLRSGRRVTGVVLPGGEHACDAVVANGDASHVFGSLLEEPQKPHPPSMSGWTALVRTRRRPRIPHGVLFPDEYGGEFRAIFDEGQVPSDPTVYVCAQESAYGRTGYEHDELLFVMANAPAVSADNGSDFSRLQARVLERLQAVEWIDAGASVVWSRTPTALAGRFPGSDGAIYGAASNSRFAAFRRPHNRVANAPGLYLAGGSAHPGGGVPLCALSGRAAARAVVSDI